MGLTPAFVIDYRGDMSIWVRISEALQALRAGENLAVVFSKLRTPPEKTVGFTIAVIALSAKMAKADGHVSRAEVIAFREIFHIPKSAERQAARVFGPHACALITCNCSSNLAGSASIRAEACAAFAGTSAGG